MTAGMDVIYYPADRPPARWRAPVLGLGNFDAFHRGHALIVERVRRRAAAVDRSAVLLTFDPHPTRIVRPDLAPRLLMTMSQKLAYIAAAGLHGAAIVRFTREMARWEPETFVTTILVDWLQVSEVWVGTNFLFGRDRGGDVTQLKALGGRHGFHVDTIEPVRYGGSVVSSTRIRHLIADGSVAEAGALLGHHYTIEGEVVRGSGRGRRHGYPTANLRTDNEVLPPDGVYATAVGLDGVMRASVTNIGVRPTFESAGARVVETHVLDVDEDLYGKRVQLAFVRHVRPERKFPEADALQRQIAADCKAVRGLLAGISL